MNVFVRFLQKAPLFFFEKNRRPGANPKTFIP
jgi:hypothetical protein